MSKRVFDLIFCIPGLILLSPLFLIVGLLVKMTSKGPVFYRQIRVGRYGRDFKIWKFRTMVKDADKNGQLITKSDDRRITPIGHVLRKYKIDELPQLINVLCNDMSLVGPRPEVRKYVESYTEEQKHVLNLIPGITDVASIKYRNESELLTTIYKNYDVDEVYKFFIMPDKIHMNLAYAAKSTVFSDFKVIIKTLL